MLTDGLQKGKIPDILSDMEKITQAIKKIPDNLLKQLQESPDKSTKAESIIELLFIVDEQKTDGEEVDEPKTDVKENIKILKQSRVNYKLKGYLEYGYLFDHNLSVLGQVEKHLRNEAWAAHVSNKAKESEQLEQIAQLVSEVREVRERAEKKEKLIKKVKEHLEQNQDSNSKISTTQKIINNLSATNNMIQIIMQILY